MTTLIIGSSGLVGRNLASRLLREGESTVCMDLNMELTPDLPGATLVQGDVSNFTDVSEIIQRFKPDRVINLAYLVGRNACLQDFNRTLRINILGMDNVFRASVDADVSRVIWASTLGVYSSIDYEPGLTVTEEYPRPYSPYSSFDGSYYNALKHFNEYQALLYASRESLDVCAIRPSFIFGPGRTTGVPWACSFVDNAINGKNTHVPMHPDSTFGLIYVDDVVDLFTKITLAKTLSSNVYNTGGHLLSISEIAAEVDSVLNGTLIPDPVQTPLFQFDISNDRAHKEFGFTLSSFSESLIKHANILRAQ